MPTKPTIIELDMNKLDDILRRVEAKELRAEDYETIHTVIESYVGLYFAVGDKNTTIRRLRQMLFGIKTEKTAAVVGDRKDSQPPPLEAATASTTVTPDGKTETVSALTMDEGKLAETPRRGHGRNGADAYTAAEKIEVRHESLQPGDPCPQCEEGTVYETNRPGRAGAADRPGSRGGQSLLSPEAALQPLRCGLHHPATRGRGLGRSTMRRWAA